MPRTSARIAAELRGALHNAGIRGPYVLVGNAFGGDNVRVFASLYPAEVAALVLVEADVVSSDEERRGHAKLIASMRACRDAISAGKPWPRAPAAHPGDPARSCAQDFFFRGLPEAMWSPALNAKLLELAQTKVAMYDRRTRRMPGSSNMRTRSRASRRSGSSSRPMPASCSPTRAPNTSRSTSRASSSMRSAR